MLELLLELECDMWKTPADSNFALKALIALDQLGRDKAVGPCVT
jgi:hypothetical protein